MYIAHYKSVNQSKEFYSKPRNSLDFPTQVEMNSERYLLQSTYTVPSNAVYERILKRADELGIQKDVSID
jgi:hypothetical protein